MRILEVVKITVQCINKLSLSYNSASDSQRQQQNGNLIYVLVFAIVRILVENLRVVPPCR